MGLYYFELPKLPEVTDGSDGLKLWMAFFNAKTEADLLKIQSLGGAIMVQAVKAYHRVSASGEFRELERLRARARLDEANALSGAERKGKMIAAKNMLAGGVDANTVAEWAQLSLDEVLRLK